MNVDLRSLAASAWTSRIFWIAVIAVVIRLVLAVFFTYPNDSGVWGRIAEAIAADTTLYERPDFYYTPIWGYLLAFLAGVTSLLGGASFANQFDELLFLDGFRISYYSSVMISPEFAMVLKTALIIVDVLVAIVIRRIVLEINGDRRLAGAAFTIWLLCPITIYSSAVYVIFDNLEVLFLALCMYALFRKRPFIAGFLLLLSVLTKPFTIYLVPILFVYVLSQYQGLRVKANAAALAVGGFLVSFLIVYLPVIMSGEFMESLEFLFGRADTAGGAAAGGIQAVINSITSLDSQMFVWMQPVIIALALIIALVYHLKGNGNRETLILLSMLTLAIVFIWPVAQQCYYEPMIMLIALLVVKWGEKTPALVMLALSIPSVVYLVISHNFSLLLPLAAYTDIVPLDWVVDHLVSFGTSVDIFGGYLYDDLLWIVKIVIMAVMVTIIVIPVRDLGRCHSET